MILENDKNYYFDGEVHITTMCHPNSDVQVTRHTGSGSEEKMETSRMTIQTVQLVIQNFTKTLLMAGTQYAKNSNVKLYSTNW